MNSYSVRNTIFGKSALAGAIALGTVSIPTGVALAGSKVVPPNGGTPLVINGFVDADTNGNVDPFVVEVAANANECLRIAVTFQEADLEAVLVEPGGRIWKDDDGGPGTQPLIKAITSKKGWHILTLSHFNGAAVNADFAVTIQRLAPTNAACAGPTPPTTTTLAPAAASAKQVAPALTRQQSEPGDR